MAKERVRVSLGVFICMCVCVCVCVLPETAVFSEFSKGQKDIQTPLTLCLLFVRLHSYETRQYLAVCKCSSHHHAYRNSPKSWGVGVCVVISLVQRALHHPNFIIAPWN